MPPVDPRLDGVIAAVADGLGNHVFCCDMVVDLPQFVLQAGQGSEVGAELAWLCQGGEEFERVAQFLEGNAHLVAFGRAEVGVAFGLLAGLAGVAGELLAGEFGERQGQGFAQGVDGGGEFEQQAGVFVDGEQGGDGFTGVPRFALGNFLQALAVLVGCEGGLEGGQSFAQEDIPVAGFAEGGGEGLPGLAVGGDEVGGQDGGEQLDG